MTVEDISNATITITSQTAKKNHSKNKKSARQGHLARIPMALTIGVAWFPERRLFRVYHGYDDVLETADAIDHCSFPADDHPLVVLCIRRVEWCVPKVKILL